MFICSQDTHNFPANVQHNISFPTLFISLIWRWEGGCQLLLTTYFPLIFQLITSLLGILAFHDKLKRVLVCANLFGWYLHLHFWAVVKEPRVHNKGDSPTSRKGRRPETKPANPAQAFPCPYCLGIRFCSSRLLHGSAHCVPIQILIE